MTKIKFEIEAEKLNEGAMFLHQQLATGKARGKKFTIDQDIGGGSIILTIGKFEDHQRYIVRIRSIVTPLLDFHFKEGKNIKVEKMKKITKKTT